MTDYTELKRLAESLIELNRTNLMDWAATIEEARIGKTHTEFALAANPAAVLALIAENEQLAKTADCWDRLNIQNKALSDSFRAERDQLKAENAQLKNQEIELKAEVEALRNSSSCVGDLSALVRQLVHRLRKAAPDNDLPEKALDYLKRKGLQGSPLRNEHDDDAEREAQKIYESWAGHDGFVPWVKGGNSIKQDEARRLARAAMGKGEQP
jgi:cell division protein FtsB